MATNPSSDRFLTYKALAASLFTAATLFVLVTQAPAQQNQPDAAAPQPAETTEAIDAADDTTSSTASAKDVEPTLPERADAFFEKVNGYVLPVLFVDVSFGMRDPDEAALQDQIAAAEVRLAEHMSELDAETEKPEADRDIKRIARLKYRIELANREIKIAEERLDALREHKEAVERLPEAKQRLDAQLAVPEADRDAEALKEARQDYDEIQSLATNRPRIYQLPLIVVFLLFGGVYFTFRYGFLNLRLFRHSIHVIRGRYDNPEDHGEISHFQALTSALSATVGLGNIAGVAIAISQGGAGAVFWMWVVAFFGMSSKFSSCTLGQMYRRVEEEDPKKHSEHVLGGPFVYLAEGMKDVFGKMFGTPFGKLLAISFAFFTIMGSLGGGNMFQGNQTFAIVGDVLFRAPIENEQQLMDLAASGDVAAAEELREARAASAAVAEEQRKSYAWVGGLTMAILVGVVIVGGIKRIGEVTSKLVPAMCIFYVAVCLIIVVANIGQVPDMLWSIVAGAFTGEAMAWGGFMGVLVAGIQRGAFSNEAGLGSAAIAHSAAKTNEPVREGIVAMTGPFIDTGIVCTMTALAILITGAHLKGSAGGFTNEGVGITASAFSSLAGWLPYMLTLAVFIFAYSTMISWSYYGERAMEYLFGKAGIWPYRVIFLLFVFIAPMVSLGNLITFTDLLILSMAYPNILGMIILSPRVARAAKDYLGRLKSGEMQMTPKADAAE